MASDDSPQPPWKRNLAAILNFLLAASVLGLLLYLVLGIPPHTITNAAGITTETWGLETGSTLLLLLLVLIVI
jgi:hypothetical protein